MDLKMCHSNRFFALLCLAGLIFACFSQLASAGSSDSLQPEPQEVKEPQSVFDVLGLATVDTFYNETKLKDRLKLSKSHVKFVVKPRFTRQTYTLKTSITEVLIRCDETLTLAHAEMESLVDCKPLEAQVLAGQPPPPKKPTGPGAVASLNYVKRSTIKMKLKPEITTAQFYPLQREFIDESIQTALASSNMKSLDFGPHATSRGHYFELNFSFGIRCSGNLFTVINQTSPAPTGPQGDALPETASQLGFFGLEMYQNGGLVSLQDVSCEKPGQIIPFSLDLEFTLVKRLQFPFMSCRHTMMAQPMSSLWKYEGAIRQHRDDPAGEAYNTTIKVNSESSIFEYLQFGIDQTFVNTDFSTGFEHMDLTHPLISAIVRGNWTVDSLAKSLELYFAGDDDDDDQGLESAAKSVGVKPSVQVDFKDDPQEPHLELGLRLNRHLAAGMNDILLMSIGQTVRRFLPETVHQEPEQKAPKSAKQSKRPAAAPARQHTEL